ncbi:MAG: YckD family protein [Caloramator sp.]|nr:YckD family protein [Caloramator sp.]
MNIKKIALGVLVAGVVSSTTVFAYAATRPVDIVSKLTGKSVETLYNERSQGKTYGTIAKETGKLEEFKAEMLKNKKEILDQKVKDGTLTKEKADEILNAIKNNMASCDGTGSQRIGQKYGIGFGRGQGRGLGNGVGRGLGRGYSK